MDYINKEILNYRITNHIGEGGMAGVFEAEHLFLDEKKVAVKILDPVLARKEQIASRFLNEAKIMSRLKHPNIVEVVDFFRSEDTLAIIMELLQGESLDSFIKRKKGLSKDIAHDMSLKILRAFDYAHGKSLVHRDVKPSNIFVEESKNIKVMDFGIAKLLDENLQLTSTGTQMGTPVYMSPEQVRDAKNIDRRSDLYSFGVMLHFMLQGSPPYDSGTESKFDIFTYIVKDPLPRLTRHKQFQSIIDKATAKDPGDRYHTAQEFISALQKLRTSNSEDEEKPENKVSDKTQVFASSQEKNFKQTEDDKTEIIAGSPLKKWPFKRVMKLLALIVSVFILGYTIFFLINMDFKVRLYPVENCDGKSGYINEEGEIAIDFEYDKAYEFKEKFARVRVEEKYGFIDAEGEYLVETIYDDAESFSEGMALVEMDGLYGYINNRGKLVISPDYEDASDFNEGLALVEIDDKYGYIDKEGELVINNKYEDASDFYEGLASVSYGSVYGYIGTEGNVVIDLQYDEVGRFSEGLAIVERSDSTFIIDTEGEYQFSWPYQNSYATFKKGLAPAKNEDGAWGYIDKKGEIAIDFKYSFAGEFNDEGFAHVSMEDLETYINTKGESVSNDWYNDIYEFGEWYPVYQNERFALLDKDFQIQAGWYDEFLSFSEAYLSVVKNDKVGFVTITGRQVIPFIYDDAEPMCNGVSIVTKNDKEFFIDLSGDVVSDMYDEIGIFKNKKAIFRIADQYGIINNKGAEVLEAQFSEAVFFNRDLFKVKLTDTEENYVLINADGKRLINPVQDSDPWRYNSTDNYYYCKFWSKRGFVAHLISKQIEVPENSDLQFYWSHKSHDKYPDDKLEVRILSEKSGAWSVVKTLKGTRLHSGDGADDTRPGRFKKMTIDLSDYSGDKVFIDFKGSSGYGPYLFIKNVSIDSVGKIDLYPVQ